MRSAIALTRIWSEKAKPEVPEKSHTRFFLSSLPAGEKERSTRAVRGHWSVENRNHHKRDTCLWLEDDHRHRRPKAAINLALTRNALLALIPFEEGEPLNNCFERYHHSPTQAIKLILKGKPLP